MGGSNAIIFLLVILPQLSLADMSASGILDSCQGSRGDCIIAIDSIKGSMTGIIQEICKSSHQATEMACLWSVERALDRNSELPVDYLKNECFGSSPKTTAVCKDIGNMCNQHKNSESCAEIIPKNTNTGTLLKDILRICGNTANDCDLAVKSRAATITTDDVAEVCRSTSKSVKTACHYMVLRNMEKKLTIDFWKSLCGPKNTKEEDKRLCEEITDVCGYNPSADFCVKLKTASVVEEEKSDSMMLIIIVAGAVLGLVVIAVLVYFFRKKIFKSHYNKKKKNQKGGDKDKKKKKKKKTGSKGSADSEVTTEAESAQASAQGSGVGPPSTDKKEEDWMGVPFSRLQSDVKDPK